MEIQKWLILSSWVLKYAWISIQKIKQSSITAVEYTCSDKNAMSVQKNTIFEYYKQGIICVSLMD